MWSIKVNEAERVCLLHWPYFLLCSNSSWLDPSLIDPSIAQVSPLLAHFSWPTLTFLIYFHLGLCFLSSRACIELHEHWASGISLQNLHPHFSLSRNHKYGLDPLDKILDIEHYCPLWSWWPHVIFLVFQICWSKLRCVERIQNGR
jgi:hypothetical protein